LDNQHTVRVENLQRALERSGIKAEIAPDITAALWAKFLFVASWGGIGAITRAPIGVIRSVAQTRRMLEQSMQEIYEVARALKINLEPNPVSASMGFLDTLPPSGTTSLQRDMAENRPSEIDSWSGAVVRLGREAGVSVPTHEFVYNSLLPLELKARGKLQFPDSA
jgi:2-dehydropantoate 2-reductase